MNRRKFISSTALSTAAISMTGIIPSEEKESHGDHVRNFIDCIKTRRTPACPPETGRAAALHVHIPNIAARVGEPVLIWDDINTRFTNSEKANQLITPDYRLPWTMPAV